MGQPGKVDFVLIGGQKCGSSSLAIALARHSEICFCDMKEPHYFSKYYKPHHHDYHGLFNNMNLVCGEASTSYSFVDEHPELPARLKKYNPDLKIIMITRDPVKRIESHYHHRLLKGERMMPIDHEVINKSYYLNRSRYGHIISKYLEFFNKEHLLIIEFNDLIENYPFEMVRLAEFLNIETYGFGETLPHENKSINRVSSINTWKKVSEGLDTLKVPHRIKSWIKQHFFSNRLSQKFKLSPDTAKLIRKKLNEDNQQLKEYCNIDYREPSTY